MPHDISRRELVQIAGAAAVSMVAATAWTGTAKPDAAPEAATGVESAAPATTLFPWVGI